MSEAAAEKCRGILEDLEPRLWGQVVDEFLNNFKTLDEGQRDLVIGNTPAAGRISLQYQFLHEVRRNCRIWDAETAQGNFADLLWLASLGRLAEDWRDGVLAVESLLDGIEEAGKLRQLKAAWLEVRPHLPAETVAFLEPRIQKRIGDD